MTPQSTGCIFDAVFKGDMEKATAAQGRKLIEQHCEGYHWRVDEKVFIFEPRDSKRSALGAKIEAVDEGKKDDPGGFFSQLAESAGLPRPQGTYSGMGFVVPPRKKVHFKTPAGTLRDAIVSAAKQYRGTIWSVTYLDGGYRRHVDEPEPPPPLPKK